MQFYGLAEEWPDQSTVFFRALPGCSASAATTEAALGAAPEAIEHYVRWLKANDIVLFEEEVNPIEIVLAERQSSLGESGPFFEADRAAPTDQEITNALNVAATARAWIIELFDEIPASLHQQVAAPGGWSLAQHLEHLMESETYYVSRLSTSTEPEQPLPPGDVEAISMKMFENAMDYELLLRDLPLDQRAQVFTHEGIQWTAAKVLRRMTHHLREHATWMRELAQQVAAKNL